MRCFWLSRRPAICLRLGSQITEVTQTTCHAEHEHGHDEEIGLPNNDNRGHEHSHVHHGRISSKDVNMQAAYLHVLTDTIQSLFVAIAGAVIWKYPSFQILDSIATFLFAGLVAYTTIPLSYRVFHIFMEGVPPEISWEKVNSALLAVEGVVSVDHLHIWSLSSSSISLTCHIQAKFPQIALKNALRVCQEFEIDHPTIQVEDYHDASLHSFKPTSLSKCISSNKLLDVDC